MGDTVYYATTTPNNVSINVATGATGAVVTFNVTGASGGGAGNYLVAPGTGATGAAVLYNALSNMLSFAVSGATGVTGVSGATGMRGLSIIVTTGPSGPLVTFDTSALQQAINNFAVTQTYDPNVGEMATGATYNGKPVYRQAWYFTVTTGTGWINNHDLISTTQYVQSIVNTGGYYATGNAGNTERYPIGASMSDNTVKTPPTTPNTAGYLANQNYGFPLVTTDNKLVFTSLTTGQPGRNDAPVFVWVDYTKV
jgi:hypothetical protein